ncbi:HlyD family efflux transporter periplasmic adaptor subunit [Roseococcus suduntuyensis]|uniref:HlyD family secretion protein n=1 Tax=Roseococcus suduntuyensis TaxID=455361 RepID=A0A840A8U7_9PROT|nr:HlyD family efflux transporter periplasmic adaptor subunit [Roseococcus suduntuyensis]MBB3897621.1 HlyD family secretion protein [Roseococcus suduntuyensis]
MKRPLLLALVLGGAALGGAWLMLGQGAPPPEPAPATAATLPEAMGVGALGRIEPASRIRRLNQPGGMNVSRLSALHVEEGQDVAAGQLLAEFADVAQKEAAIAQARGQLEEQRAALARTREAARPSEREAQRARIESLAAQVELARREAARATRLVPSGAGAEAAAERARFSLTRLEAERAQAEADLATLTAARPEDLALAEARVAVAEATLAKAEADAELSRVRAPIAGTILRIFARPGDQVGSDGLMEMADLSRMEVVADVFETDVARLRLGATAEVIIPGEARRLPATLSEIGWQVRRTTQAGTDPVAAVDARTVEVRLTLSDEAAALVRRRSNMQVQVAIRPNGPTPLAFRR